MARYILDEPDSSNIGRYVLDAEQAQSRAQMTHDKQPSKPYTIYDAQAERQSPIENAMAKMGGHLYGAYHGLPDWLVGKADPEHDAAMAGLDSGKGSFVGDLGGISAIYGPAMLAPTGPLRAAYSALTAALTTDKDIKGRAGEAALAYLGSAAGDLVPYLSRAGKAIKAPTTEAGRDKLIGSLLRRGVEPGRMDEVLDNLRQASPLLPGSLPTAADVANSGHIAATQRWAAQSNPDQYAWVGQNNETARRNALQGIAGTPEQKSAALQARSDTAESQYKTAFSKDTARIARETAPDPANSDLWWNTPKAKALPTSPILAGMTDNPVLQAARKEAIALAKSEGKDIGDPYATLQGMHYMKLAMDNRLSGKVANTALSRHADRAVAMTKSKLIDAMESISPEYTTARQTFSDMSQPINQMDVGQFLYDKLVSGLGKERGATFADQLRNANDMVQRVTGGRKTLDQVMTPQQMKTLFAIREDLMRKGQANDLGRGVGSNTFQNIAMENLSREAGIPSFMSGISRLIPTASTAGAFVKTTAQSALEGYEQKMRNRLADVLRNPQLTAQIMESSGDPGRLSKMIQSIPNPTTRQLVFDTLRSIPSLSGVGMATSANQ